jgi:hypothetical protein
MRLASEYFEEIKPSNRALHSRKPIYGMGINDAPFITNCKVGGKLYSHPAYVAWKNVLTRSFDQAYATRFPTYQGVKVCDEWLRFSNFLAWWKVHQKEGWQLDKDLLHRGNKVYSPETCIYIPNWINSFTLTGPKNTSTGRVGAFYCKNRRKYTSQCGHPISGEKIRLGYFDSEQEARYYWLKKKSKIAHELKALMDAIDHRIYKNVIEIISERR